LVSVFADPEKDAMTAKSIQTEVGEAEVELVLRALEGDVAALMRAYAVNSTWRRVCALSCVWSHVRW
jgi:hypothetical protein